MSEIIKVQDVTYVYRRAESSDDKEIKALKDVKLNIEEGSFTAILGTNGSGKSTLAKNLNALYVPTEGTIWVYGMDTRDEEHLWDIRSKAGMVFQNPDNQLVSAIVEDDVAFGPENLGVPTEEIRSQIDDAMKSTGIYEFRGKAPSALSGGQKQRVAIAGVLAMRPQCIIFDEPTAMLDPGGRQEVMDIIHGLHRKGITVILITHFMEEAAAADRVIVMEDGAVLADGSPARVFGDADTVLRAGLELPPAVQLREGLRAAGVRVPEDAVELGTLAAGLGPEAVPAVRDLLARRYGRRGPAGSPMVSVKGLRHVYNQGLPNETLALDDINFEIGRGEIVGIIGHTGSGKSTLIQHLNGILKAAEGSITIGDTVITEPGVKLSDVRKKAGLVFQYPEYQLFEETVAKDVAYGPANMGLSPEEVDARVREAIGLVGLDYDEVAERSPFELSGGQKRKAAIAGVIAMKPELLILDEPTAGLDPAAKKEILSMIMRIQKEQNSTIVLVSHNMDDVAAMCSKVFVMERGRLILQGSPEEVFAQADTLKSIGLGLPMEGELLYLMEHGAEDR